jgi:hypothetical protein
MHIGKTAGTSLQYALFEVIDAAIFHESLPNFDTASPAELAINDLGLVTSPISTWSSCGPTVCRSL